MFHSEHSLNRVSIFFFSKFTNKTKQSKASTNAKEQENQIQLVELMEDLAKKCRNSFLVCSPSRWLIQFQDLFLSINLNPLDFWWDFLLRFLRCSSNLSLSFDSFGLQTSCHPPTSQPIMMIITTNTTGTSSSSFHCTTLLFLSGWMNPLSHPHSHSIGAENRNEQPPRAAVRKGGNRVFFFLGVF